MNRSDGMRLFLPALLILSALLLFGCLQTKNDLSVCDSITDDYSQKTQCIREVAISLEDESICNKISDTTLRDYWCHREIAIITNNPGLCDKIVSEDAKKSCFNILAGTELFKKGNRN